MNRDVESTKLLSCPLCSMDYDTEAYVPYVACCGHNICVQCIPDIENAICPTCKEPTFHKMDRNYLALELIFQMDQAHKSLENAKGILDEATEEKDLYWRDNGIKGASPKHMVVETSSSNACARSPSAPLLATGNNPVPPSLVEIQAPLQNEDNSPESKTIEIFNVPPHWNRPDINEKFGLWGNARIVRSFLSRYPDGRSKGYATVDYENPVSAKEAVFTLNDTDNGAGEKLIVKLKTKKMPLNKAIKMKRFNSKTSIHIANLGNVTEEQLRNHFEQHGLVLAVMLSRDNLGRPTGNANINYQYDTCAQKAIKMQNGKHFPDSNQKMIVESFHEI